MNYLSLDEQKKMIGKEVIATGCCGMKDGIEVKGILKQISPYAVVDIKYYRNHSMPCMVNNQTLKLVL